MLWWDVVGWCGSALLVFSVMQARVLRFRVLNLGACVVLAAFNADLRIWPMVAMNLALCAINLWHVRGLVGTRHDDAAYAVLEVGADDSYLRHVLAVHAEDIRRFQPDLVWPGTAQDDARPADTAYLVQRGDETVGVVLLHDEGDGTARVRLDYVTPRFRDFSPGEFVWRRSGILREHGYRRVVTPEHMVGAYYGRLGFTPRADGTFELDLAVA